MDDKQGKHIPDLQGFNEDHIGGNCKDLGKVDICICARITAPQGPAAKIFERSRRESLQGPKGFLSLVYKIFEILIDKEDVPLTSY